MNKIVADRLRAELERIEAQIEALTNEAKGLRRAMALVEGDSAAPAVLASPSQPKKGRVPIKDTVISLVMENKATGLNAATLVSVAAARGIELDRASVSSLLSRLKKDGVLEYDGNVYRPAAPSARPNPVAQLTRAAA